MQRKKNRGPPRKPRRNIPPRRPRPAVPRRNGNGAAMRIGGSIGQGLGNLVMPGLGGTIGGTLGKGLGWAFKKVTGVGDYKVQANTLTMSGSPVPTFGENCIRIRHKEYLGDVLGTTAFSNAPYAINPGLASSFPWLATIAGNYQEYYFAGLMYSFVSTSASALNSTNTALGKIIMATDYNAVNAAFTTPPQMLATEFSNYGKPAENLLHAVECHPAARPTAWQYVRTSAVAAGRDARLYDMGIFQLASQGMQASANIGGLWVAYDIILCKPVIQSLGLMSDVWFATDASTTTTIALTAVNQSTRQIGATISGTALNPVLNLPRVISSGTYRLQVVVHATTGANVFQTAVQGTANVANSIVYDPLGVGFYNSLLASNTGDFLYYTDLSVTGPGATITLRPPITTVAITGSIIVSLLYLGP